MSTKTTALRLTLAAFTVFVCSAGLIAQQDPSSPNSAAPNPAAPSSASPSPASASAASGTSLKEFPVVMKQDVTAGKTPVGTKVEAKLSVATLVDGTVFPKNTVFSGEVTESVAKSDNGPSRVAIRMDSAHWKNGSAPVKLYLTAWFYPVVLAGATQDLAYGPPQPASKTWNGAGTYPDSSPASKPFPSQDMSGGAVAAPESSIYKVSKQRVLMKDVDSEHNSEGAVAISSKRFNIKVDKLTTYVLATGELTTRKPGD
jgi:hypothetical protein